MNTKSLGNIGEANILAKLVELDFGVYIQFGDNEPADYIISNGKKLLKIQVKTSVGNENCVKFDLTSNYKIKGKIHKHKYTTDEVDYFLCYDVTSKDIFYLKNNGNLASIIFRYNLPKNKQTKNINFAKDFIFKKDSLKF